jgi:hypothetical protein
VKEFGSVPKGALLFILEPAGPKTPGKFRDDGVGDATHMGIVTGRGDGAIHSSKSRGGVVTSKFKGKTIPNGGWNRVGLLPVFDYGVRRSLDCARDDTEGSRDDTEGGRDDKEERMTGIVAAETGQTVNLRETMGGKLIERIPIGTEVTILEYGPEWSKVEAGKYKGYMMTQFLVPDDGDTAEPDLLSEIYETLRELCERIENVIAKG